MIKSYATQCDRLRSSPSGEQTWIALVSRAQSISREDLEQSCDLSDLLSDGETLDDFVGSDPFPGFYKTRDGEDRDVYFIMHSGFEFFFGDEGRWPAHTQPTEMEIRLHTEYSRDALAMAMLAADDPRISGAPHPEREVERHGNLRVIHGGDICDADSHIRLILEDESGPVAGVRISEGALIDQIYTRSDRRRQGLATELVTHARELFSDLQMDSARTPDGEALWRATNDEASYDHEPGWP